MKKRKLGKNLTVSEIGLGCMTIGRDYSSEAKQEAVRIIRRAYDLGVTMFDTAELYAEGRNETLAGEALKPFRDKVVIATKCGVMFEAGHVSGNASGKMIMDSRPEKIRSSIEGSLKRLQTDYIDLYYIHRVDPKVPIETVAQTMAELHREGKILNWGISEPSMETLRKAHEVFPVSAVESEYNMMWREPEQEILPTLEELGVGLVPYRPLARGFLTGASDGMYLHDAKNTRFDWKNLAANMALKNFVQDLAAEKNVSAAQISLAWLLAQKDFIVPIPGTSKMERMEENVNAANVSFTDEELKNIRELLEQIPIYGERYDPESDNGKSVRR
ncbi:MAG: aldo/keto reductase [Synergistaceae bacterium]|nr:aldo/keto reductase [Synergistaceae bacterium]